MKLRLPTPPPRTEQIYFIGACNVPIDVLDPALTRPGRMGRHIWFRTPTKDDRLDIFDLYLTKVDHEPDLDTDRRRDELARITNGYSPSMIEQCCSMALTIAHAEGRPIVRLVGHRRGDDDGRDRHRPEHRVRPRGDARGGDPRGRPRRRRTRLPGEGVLSTRLSIRKRGGSLGHYQGMEKDERFSHFRSRVMGSLIMTLGAMAAEHVFYGENSQGVSGDVLSATSDGRGDGRDLGDGSRPGPHRRQPRSRRGGRARARAPRADRLDDHEPRQVRRHDAADPSPPCWATATSAAPPRRSSARPTSPPTR